MIPLILLHFKARGAQFTSYLLSVLYLTLDQVYLRKKEG